jgi:Zn-finger nucleic acid-binding protein
MKCPACSAQLQERSLGEITVDVCDAGCGGIWFDRHELQKVDEHHEASGESLLAITRRPTPVSDESPPRRCPHCTEQNLFRHFHSVKHQVEVDDCPRCGGVWLDVGELAIIRNQYPTEDERREAAAGYFEDVFGDKLGQLHAQSQEGEEKARRIARAFRFICPTYYIPGKQGWGAF